MNPPGEGYRECAETIGRQLEAFDFADDYPVAVERTEHSEARLQATLAADNQMRELRSNLEDAVEAEEYERAAEIRDAIRKLEVNGGSE